MHPRVRKVILAIVLPLLPACSVKENRDACPCYVNYNFDELISEGYRSALVSVSSDVSLYREDLDLLSVAGSGLDVPVPKTYVRSSVVLGLDRSYRSGDTLAVRENVEADAVYVWSDLRLCREEVVSLRPRPRKQYCKVDIIVTGVPPGAEYPYDMQVRANCCGLDLFDLLPVEGKYSTVVRKNNTSSYSVRIPRQKESDIILDFLEKSGDDEPVGGIDLGNEMDKKGYDWTKESLDDIFVILDFVRMDFSLKIVEWDPYKLEIEI